MARGDTNVQLVSGSMTAANIKTAFDDCAAVIGLSGSFMAASFNDGRGLAVIGIDNRP